MTDDLAQCDWTHKKKTWQDPDALNIVKTFSVHSVPNMSYSFTAHQRKDPFKIKWVIVKEKNHN